MSTDIGETEQEKQDRIDAFKAVLDDIDWEKLTREQQAELFEKLEARLDETDELDHSLIEGLPRKTKSLDSEPIDLEKLYSESEDADEETSERVAAGDDDYEFSVDERYKLDDDFVLTPIGKLRTIYYQESTMIIEKAKDRFWNKFVNTYNYVAKHRTFPDWVKVNRAFRNPGFWDDRTPPSTKTDWGIDRAVRRKLMLLIGMKKNMSRDEIWMWRYNQLVEFNNEFGHTRVSVNSKLYPGLGRWVANQRHLARTRSKRMTDDRRNSLKELSFDWDLRADYWKNMVEKLAQYIENQGISFIDPYVDRALFRFAQGQRKRKKEGRLTRAKIDKLENIGFKWRVVDCVHGGVTRVDEIIAKVLKKAFDETAGTELNDFVTKLATADPRKGAFNFCYSHQLEDRREAFGFLEQDTRTHCPFSVVDDEKESGSRWMKFGESKNYGFRTICLYGRWERGGLLARAIETRLQEKFDFAPYGVKCWTLVGAGAYYREKVAFHKVYFTFSETIWDYVPDEVKFNPN